MVGILSLINKREPFAYWHLPLYFYLIGAYSKFLTVGKCLDFPLTFQFNGDAIICCHDWNRATVVGNARTSSLREIWNSEKINEIRRLILRKRYGQIDSCQECSLVKKW